MNLTITLKETFGGVRVQAELQGHDEGGKKEPIVFVRAEEHPTLEQRIVMLQKAEQFAKEHKLRLWENQEPPILPLDGKWFRVRLGLIGKPDANIVHQLLVSTDGRVADGMKRVEVIKLLWELVPSPHTDADYQGYLEKYILASSPHDTRIISRLSDIPGYDKQPLDKDFAEIIRPPFRLGEKDTAFYIFYTYEREGGIVKRWKCNFYKESLWNNDTIILGTGIGNAIFRG